MIGGVLAAASVAVWWPGEQPPPLAVAMVQAQQGATTKPTAAPDTDTTEANNASAQRKLEQYIEADFVDTPLTDVLAFLAEKTQVETYVHRASLADNGVSLDALVSIKLKKVRGDMLLELVLQQVGGLDYVLRDGIAVITTVESLDIASEVKAYPVADLLKLHGARPEPADGSFGGLPGASPMAPGGEEAGGFGGGFAPVSDGHTPNNVAQLIRVISSTVAPDTWQDMGGNGTITYYGDMLVVRQNARTHREVEKVLKLLRDTAAKK
jgi:hypothetical protein